MVNGQASDVADLQKGKLKGVRAKGIGPIVARYKPARWDPEGANVEFQNRGVRPAWLFGILSV
eukprot:9314991-Lingulodinium_polyedra.AAC.1